MTFKDIINVMNSFMGDVASLYTTNSTPKITGNGIILAAIAIILLNHA